MLVTFFPLSSSVVLDGKLRHTSVILVTYAEVAAGVQEQWKQQKKPKNIQLLLDAQKDQVEFTGKCKSYWYTDLTSFGDLLIKKYPTLQ